jgi:hypothetical protein
MKTMTNWFDWKTKGSRRLIWRWQAPIQVLDVDWGKSAFTIELLVRYPWMAYWETTAGHHNDSDIPF